VTSPPAEAELVVILLMAAVVTVGAEEGDEVVKLTFEPYEVPTLLVA
jgi:hypothetical protein